MFDDSAQGARLRWLVRSVHALLLVLLMAMPLTGLLSSAFSGYGVHLFGWIIVPQNVDVLGETEAFNTEVYETEKWLHRMLAYLFSALVALHIMAALKHHFVDKDNSLCKMLGT